MDPTPIIASMRELINYSAFVSVVIIAMLIVFLDDHNTWLTSLLIFLLCIACVILVGTA